MELLAPAGSKEALIAAVNSGCDAVYVGGSRFSARGSCDNFSQDELKEWAEYCHLYGVKIHIAANTLIKEKETKDFLEYIGYLNKIGIDCVIIQDLGMASAVHRMYPELEIHASTQITCASVETAKSLERMGFSRIVLARELDIESIKRIKEAVRCEIEVFVHGAICMSYSGQCLFSSVIGGRSGNRGYCAQPCRLPYTLYNNSKSIKKGYLLSPKDMCLAEHLKELEKIGVDSLKIEGRLKRPEYVSTVVGVYRDLLDTKKKATNEQKKELLDAFNRSGFTDGYFTDKTGINMMSYQSPSNISKNIFTKDAVMRLRDDIIFRKIPISITAKLELGRPLFVTATDGVNKVIQKSEELTEYAITNPISKDRLKSQLSKLGNTPFEIENIEVYVDDDVTIPISQINETRRNLVQKLIELKKQVKERKVQEYSINFNDKNSDEPIISASVKNAKQLEVCIEKGIKIIYAPYKLIKDKYSSRKIKFIAEDAPINRNDRQNARYRSVLCKSLGQFVGKDEVYADFRLNVTNSYTAELLKNTECITLSPELTINELKEIKKPTNTEIIAYGRLPLMVYENCPVKANGLCDRGKTKNYLMDRMGEKFPLICAVGCYCELFNGKPIYMADKIDDIKKTGVSQIRLAFTDETRQECEKIIDDYKKALEGKKVLPLEENTFTRGHFYKGIM